MQRLGFTFTSLEASLIKRGGQPIRRAFFQNPWKDVAREEPSSSSFNLHILSPISRLSVTYFSCISQGGATPQNVADDIEEKRRKLNRLLYRSRQRGYLELDLVLGKWAEQNLPHLDNKRLNDLAEVLDLENPDLWKWLTGQETPPADLSSNPVFKEIHGQIFQNLDVHAPAEIRTKPGQPWVRGWDDISRTSGPPAGNQ